MSKLRDAGKFVLEEVLRQLEQLGASPEALEELGKEIMALMFVALDPTATPEARQAAMRNLEAIPLRLRQQLIVAEVQVRDKITALADKFLTVLRGLVGFIP